MIRKGSRWFAVMGTLAAVGLFGCGGGAGSDSADSGGRSSLRVLVTDAPFSFGDVRSAKVEVQRVDLHRTGDGEDQFETLITFPSGREIDLVQLQNGVTETLFEGNPAPGSYDAARVVVVPKEIVIDDDGTERSFPFKVPSGPQTGIKVFVKPAIDVVSSLTTDLLLDIDLNKSFTVQGNPSTPAGIKGFHFKPVVRAVNTSVAGSLAFGVRSDSGTPLDPADDVALSGASYAVTDSEGQDVATGVSGLDGHVLNPAVLAGVYTVTVKAANHDPRTLEAVTIAAANLTDLGAVTLARTRGVVAGTVTTELLPASGPPALTFAVEGATVSAGGVSASTDGAGSYQIPDLAVGTYVVDVTKAGYEPLSAAGTAWAPGTTPVESDYSLIPLPADVGGVVRDGLGVAVAGAAVTAAVEFGGTGVPIATATTDGSGHYTLPLWTGSYEISASLGAISASTTLDIVGGGGPIGLDLTLP